MTNADALGEGGRGWRLIVPANLLLTTNGGPVKAGSVEPGMVVLSGDERWCEVLAAGQAGIPGQDRDVSTATFLAGALAEGVPTFDVTIGSDSRLWTGSHAVRAGQLVNTATVVAGVLRADRMIALELATDAPFDLLGIALAPNAATADEVEMGEAELLALRRHLLERAIALGWQYIEDRRIQVAVDGSIVSATSRDGSRWRVTLRRPSLVLSIFSASAVVAQHHPNTLDDRRLGVQITGVRADGEEIALSSDAFAAGFHQVEQAPTYAFRWTDGAATLRLPRRARMIDFDIGMGLGALARA